MKKILILLFLLSFLDVPTQAEIIRVKCKITSLSLFDTKMTAETKKRFVGKFIEWEIDTEKKIIQNLSSDLIVLTGVQDQVSFTSSSASAKDYELDYKSTLKVRDSNNSIIDYNYAGKYGIYNQNNSRAEFVDIKIYTGTFKHTFKVKSNCK